MQQLKVLQVGLSYEIDEIGTFLLNNKEQYERLLRNSS